MTTIFAIDPGPTRSAYLIAAPGSPLAIVEYGYEPNLALLARLLDCEREHELVIEEVEHYGLPAGRDVFQTVRWSGRFEQAWQPGFVRYVPRRAVKLELCGSPRANDGTVRQAVIDRFGGDEVAIGGVQCRLCHGSGTRGRGKAKAACERCHGEKPAAGPLKGIANDVWSALALALTATARKGRNEAHPE